MVAQLRWYFLLSLIGVPRYFFRMLATGWQKEHLKYTDINDRSHNTTIISVYLLWAKWKAFLVGCLLLYLEPNENYRSGLPAFLQHKSTKNYTNSAWYLFFSLDSICNPSKHHEFWTKKCVHFQKALYSKSYPDYSLFSSSTSIKPICLVFVRKQAPTYLFSFLLELQFNVNFSHWGWNRCTSNF